ncbi:uncharacterized protein [Palaemon carinicauda]|uniref:uncharacterized protein n=1 Tax=Palaemon carinicauda TaxID=392227 RepID=UPI0035B5A538
MRILRWILGISLLERLENYEVRIMTGVVKIAEIIRSSRQMVWAQVEEGVRGAWEQPIKGRRSRGREKIRWRDRVKDDIDRKANLPTDTKTPNSQHWRAYQETMQALMANSCPNSAYEGANSGHDLSLG